MVLDNLSSFMNNFYYIKTLRFSYYLSLILSLYLLLYEYEILIKRISKNY
jgi:hypothetical protein